MSTSYQLHSVQVVTVEIIEKKNITHNNKSCDEDAKCGKKKNPSFELTLLLISWKHIKSNSAGCIQQHFVVRKGGGSCLV